MLPFYSYQTFSWNTFLYISNNVWAHSCHLASIKKKRCDDPSINYMFIQLLFQNAYSNDFLWLLSKNVLKIQTRYYKEMSNVSHGVISEYI